MADWWLVRRRKHLETAAPLDPHKDIAGSIISLDKRNSHHFIKSYLNLFGLQYLTKYFFYSIRGAAVC